MRGRGFALLRALGALVLLFALVVGVPALLVLTVGNPFPSELPTIDEIRITLTQNGDGFSTFVISALALFVWFVWMQLMVALAVEIVAAVRNREARRLPTAPGIQALAARLVASIALAATLTAAPVIAPALGALDLDGFGPAPAPQTAEHVVAEARHAPSIGPASSTASVDVVVPATDADGTSLLLADDVELWDLADSAYGDGVHWKLIATANAGAADAAGHMITADTEALTAGTIVRLPGPIDTAVIARHGSIVEDASAAEAPAVASSPGTDVMASAAVANVDLDEPIRHLEVIDGVDVALAADGVHVVEAGDSMWSVAEAEVERRLGATPSEAQVAEYWVEVVDANHDVPSGDVDLIHPGDRLVMPDAGAPIAERLASDTADDEAPDEPAQRTPDVAGVVDGPPGDSTSRSEAVRSSGSTGAVSSIAGSAGSGQSVGDGAADSAAVASLDAGLPVAPLTLAAFGSALVASGVVGALRRRRALQRRMRAPGELPRLPTSEAAAFEVALQHAASEVIESEQGNGWRLLPGETVAALRASGPLEMRASSDGGLTAVPLSLETNPDRDERPTVALERDGDPAHVLDGLDLDVATDVVGPEPGEAVLPTALVLGTEIVSGEAVMVDLASVRRLEVHGERADVRRFLRGVLLDLAVSERADDLCMIAVGIGDELGDLERVRTAANMSDALVSAVRCGHAGADSSTPVVVVAETPHDDEDEDATAALIDLGATIVAPGQPDAEMRISLTGHSGQLSPGGTGFVIAAPDDDQYRHIAELVDVTGLDATAGPEDRPEIEDVLELPTPTVDDVEPGPVEVKVLGPVEIDGAGSFSSVKAVDVVAYLAFHRHGVDADQLKTWVWPAFEPPTDKAFANVMSRARTALGTDDDGTPHLSRAGSDRLYRLHETVTTDFDRFRSYVAQADEADDGWAELAALRRALELIRGIPFTGGAATSFAWADNHVRAHVEFVVDEAVHRCADLALELGELATAREAAFTGLEVVPGCEQCFRRRFLVASADNNRSELRRAMADLERTAAAELGEPEAVDLISGDLLALYNELDQHLMAGTA